MAYEVITLNLIPSGDIPVIHAAQYDVDRPLKFALKLGEDDFNPSGHTLELQIRKVDNNIVTAAPDDVTGNVVTFMSTQQMCACSGTNLGEIQITKDNLDIATLHFYLVIQRDVLAGGLTSQSEIHDLEDQIAEIVPEVIGDEYYTAAEVDEKIAEIPTFDPTNYYDKTQLYTKTETNGLLSQKANTSSLANVAFSGSYTDLNNTPVIPDVSDYYTKEQTYSQSEVNTLLGQKADTSSLASVATSGDYTDLTNKPTIIQYGTDLPMSTTEPTSMVADRIEACETAISGKQNKAWTYVGGLYDNGPSVDISAYNEIAVILETGVSGTPIRIFNGLFFKAIFDLYPTVRLAYYGSASYNVSGDMTYNNGALTYAQFSLTGWTINNVRIFGR